MKLSTRLKKTLWCGYITGWGDTTKVMRFFVDCKKMEFCTSSLSAADKYHKHLTEDLGYKLLPNECPVVNEKEIVLHYTSTNYSEWCKGS